MHFHLYGNTLAQEYLGVMKFTFLVDPSLGIITTCIPSVCLPGSRKIFLKEIMYFDVNLSASIYFKSTFFIFTPQSCNFASRLFFNFKNISQNSSKCSYSKVTPMSIWVLLSPDLKILKSTYFPGDNTSGPPNHYTAYTCTVFGILKIFCFFISFLLSLISSFTLLGLGFQFPP